MSPISGATICCLGAGGRVVVGDGRRGEAVAVCIAGLYSSFSTSRRAGRATAFGGDGSFMVLVVASCRWIRTQGTTATRRRDVGDRGREYRTRREKQRSVATSTRVLQRARHDRSGAGKAGGGLAVAKRSSEDQVARKTGVNAIARHDITHDRHAEGGKYVRPYHVVGDEGRGQRAVEISRLRDAHSRAHDDGEQHACENREENERVNIQVGRRATRRSRSLGLEQMNAAPSKNMCQSKLRRVRRGSAISTPTKPARTGTAMSWHR